MTHDEAMKLARDVLNTLWPYMAPTDGAVAIQIASQEELTRMLREIENGAYERVEEIVHRKVGNFFDREETKAAIHFLIQPPAQKENGE